MNKIKLLLSVILLAAVLFFVGVIYSYNHFYNKREICRGTICLPTCITVYRIGYPWIFWEQNDCSRQPFVYPGNLLKDLGLSLLTSTTFLVVLSLLIRKK